MSQISAAAYLDAAAARCMNLRRSYPHLIDTSIAEDIADVELAITHLKLATRKIAEIERRNKHCALNSEAAQFDGGMVDLVDQFVGSILHVIECNAESEPSAALLAHRTRQDAARAA